MVIWVNHSIIQHSFNDIFKCQSLTWRWDFCIRWPTCSYSVSQRIQKSPTRVVCSFSKTKPPKEILTRGITAPCFMFSKSLWWWNFLVLIIESSLRTNRKHLLITKHITVWLSCNESHTKPFMSCRKQLQFWMHVGMDDVQVDQSSHKVDFKEHASFTPKFMGVNDCDNFPWCMRACVLRYDLASAVCLRRHKHTGGQ